MINIGVSPGVDGMVEPTAYTDHAPDMESIYLQQETLVAPPTRGANELIPEAKSISGYKELGDTFQTHK
jgi:hypothetical protein